MTEKGEIRSKRERAPFFVCCIVCRFSPFLCHLTLPSSHLLTASALSLSSFLLWFCPPLDPYLLSLFWQASTQIWLPILFSSTHRVLQFSSFTFTPTSTISFSCFPLLDLPLVPPPIKMSKTLLCFVSRFRFTRVHEPARFCK